MKAESTIRRVRELSEKLLCYGYRDERVPINVAANALREFREMSLELCTALEEAEALIERIEHERQVLVANRHWQPEEYYGCGGPTKP